MGDYGGVWLCFLYMGVFYLFCGVGLEGCWVLEVTGCHVAGSCWGGTSHGERG